ncbi:Hypothetical predicted protein [Lecanosticta acicola]|uniref:Uncharacterized protein n=1 Tax=Lecanosticta acicola TaxID=111012 RepID=A0AAI8Z8A4_9PEZI|nr:Hypothetical predicted protein [Lecanosticta acicola]
MPSRDQGDIPLGSPQSTNTSSTSRQSGSFEPGEIRNTNPAPIHGPNQGVVPPGRRPLNATTPEYQDGWEAPAFPGYRSQQAAQVSNVAAYHNNNNLDSESSRGREVDERDSRPSTLEEDMESLFVAQTPQSYKDSYVPTPAAATMSGGRGISEDTIVYADGSSPATLGRSLVADHESPTPGLSGLRKEQQDVDMAQSEHMTPADRPKRGPTRCYGVHPDAFDMANPDEARLAALVRKRNEKLSQQDPDFHEDDADEDHDFHTPASAVATEEDIESTYPQRVEINTPSASESEQEMDLDEDEDNDNDRKGPITPTNRKRPSPERTLSNSAKRHRSANKDKEPKFRASHFHKLEDTGAAERLAILKHIGRLWGMPCERAIPHALWPLSSGPDAKPLAPRDVANPGLLRIRELARMSPGAEGLRAAIEALTTITELRPRPKNRLLYLADVDRAIMVLHDQAAAANQAPAQEQPFADAPRSEQRQQPAVRRDSSRGSSDEGSVPIKKEIIPTSPTTGHLRHRALLDLRASDLQSLSGDEFKQIYRLLQSEMNRRLDSSRLDGSSQAAAISID